MSSKISSLPELVSARALELGSKVAFIDDAAQISYEEIHEKVKENSYYLRIYNNEFVILLIQRNAE